MTFQNLVTLAQANYFPDLEIKYKDQSLFMKILGKILFFAPTFMTSYTTTIGSTVYFPSENFVKLNSVSSLVILLHELVHIHDAKRVTKPVFSLSYLLPQILFPLCALLFLVSWKIALPLTLLSLAPIPAFFRAYWEKRAYISSLYTTKLLSVKMGFDTNLETQAQRLLQNFQGPAYYFMWPFHNIDKEFSDAAKTSEAGNRPYQDPVFDMLEDLIAKL